MERANINIVKKVFSVFIAAVLAISLNPLFTSGYAYAAGAQGSAATSQPQASNPDSGASGDSATSGVTGGSEQTSSNENSKASSSNSQAKTQESVSNNDSQAEPSSSENDQAAPAASQGMTTLDVNKPEATNTVTYGDMVITTTAAQITDQDITYDQQKKIVTIKTNKDLTITQNPVYTQHDTSLVINSDASENASTAKGSNLNITMKEVGIDVSSEATGEEGKGRACIDVLNKTGTVTITFEGDCNYLRDCKNYFYAGAGRAAIEKNDKTDCTLILKNNGSVKATAGTGDAEKQQGPAAIGSAAGKDVSNLRVEGGNWRIYANACSDRKSNDYGAAIGSGSDGNAYDIYVKGGSGARPERGDWGTTGESEVFAQAFHGAAIGAGYPATKGREGSDPIVAEVTVEGGNVVAQNYPGASNDVAATGPGLGVNLIDPSKFKMDEIAPTNGAHAKATIEVKNTNWMRALSWLGTAVECGDEGTFTYDGGYFWSYGGFINDYGAKSAETAYSIHAKTATFKDAHPSEENWALIDSSQSHGIVADEVNFESGEAIVWGCSDDFHQCKALQSIVTKDLKMTGGKVTSYGGIQIKDQGKVNVSGGYLFSIITSTSDSGSKPYYALGVEPKNNSIESSKADFTLSGGAIDAYGGIIAGGQGTINMSGASVISETGSSVVYQYGGSAQVPAYKANTINMSGGAARGFVHGVRKGSRTLDTSSLESPYFPTFEQRTDYSKMTDYAIISGENGESVTTAEQAERFKTGFTDPVDVNGIATRALEGSYQAESNTTSALGYQYAFSVIPTFDGKYSHVVMGAKNDTDVMEVMPKELQSWSDYNRVDILPAVKITMKESETVEMEYGKTIDMKATLDPTDATVSYSSSNTDVATVDDKGLVSLVGIGDTDIMCSPIGDYQTESGEPAKTHLTVTTGKGSAQVSLDNWEYTTNDALKPDPVVTSNSHNPEYAKISYSKKDGSDKSDKKPTEVGKYTVYAEIPANENYSQITVQDDFEIKKATPTINPEDSEVLMVQGKEDGKVRVSVSKPVTLTAKAQDASTIRESKVTDVTSQVASDDPDVKYYDVTFKAEKTGTTNVTLTVEDCDKACKVEKTVSVEVKDNYTCIPKPTLKNTSVTYDGTQQQCINVPKETASHVNVKSTNSDNPCCATDIGNWQTTFELKSGYAWDNDKQGTNRGSCVLNWGITKRDVGNSSKTGCSVNVNVGNPVVYNSRAYTPTVTATYQTSDGKTVTLEQNKDYTVEYQDNQAAGNAKVIVKGIGEHTTGTYTKSFTIQPADLGNTNQVSTMGAPYWALDYDGTPQKPNVRLYTSTNDLMAEGKDYTLTLQTPQAKDAGEYKVTAKPASGSNFKGTREMTYKIRPIDLSSLSMKGLQAKVLDGKKEVTQDNIQLVNDSGKVIPKSDYKITYKNNDKVGTATMTITPAKEEGGNLTGELSVNFPITEKKGTLQVIEEPTSQTLTYNGEEQVGIPDSDKYTIEGDAKATNYSYEYVAYVTPKAGYAWDANGDVSRKRVKWSIRKANFADATITGLKSPVAYAGDKITQNLGVVINGATVNKDYVTVDYQNNTDVGKATVTLKPNNAAPNDYQGEKVVTFDIVKAQSSILPESTTIDANVEQGRGVDAQMLLSYRGDGELIAESADESIATAVVVPPTKKNDGALDFNDYTLVVKPASHGTTAITIKSHDSKNFEETEATVYVNVTQRFNGLILLDEPVGRTLTYNGNEQYGIANDPDAFEVVEGNLSGTDAKDYTVTVKPNDQYAWADKNDKNALAENAGEQKTVTWKIEKQTGSFTSDEMSDTKIDLKDGKKAVELKAAYVGDGNVTATSSKAEVADVTVSTKDVDSTTKTVTAKITPKAVGSTLITLTPTNKEQSNFTSVSPITFWVNVVDSSRNFKVVPKAPVAATNLTYNGTEQIGVAKGTGYVLSGPSVKNGNSVGTNAGTYYVEAKPDKGYAWDDSGNADPRMLVWTIKPANISSASASVVNKTYTGEDLYQDEMKLTLGGKTIPEEEYEVIYNGDHKNVGNRTLTVKARDGRNYTGSKTVSYKITAASTNSVQSIMSDASSFMADNLDPVAAVQSMLTMASIMQSAQSAQGTQEAQGVEDAQGTQSQAAQGTADTQQGAQDENTSSSEPTMQSITDQVNTTLATTEGTPGGTTGGTTGTTTDTPADQTAPLTNDPGLSKQYYFNPNKGKTADGQYAGANVAEAWRTMSEFEQDTVTVAVIDTGMDLNSQPLIHEDLITNVDYDNARDVYNKHFPEGGEHLIDSDGHGTHVAGIVSAAANNGKGIAGVSHNAKVLPIKVFDDDGLYASTADLIEAYEYLGNLVDEGKVDNLRVVNLSLGSYQLSQEDLLFEDAIEDLAKKGVLTVAAGGNGNGVYGYTEHSYPSDFESVLSVTSLSKWGNDSAWSDYNMDKDISAPGEEIYSTFPGGSGGLYQYLSGTSQATPIVAGTAAMLFSVVPEATVDDVRDAITSSAQYMDHLGNVRHNNTGSAGALDADAALNKLLDKYGNAKNYLKDCTVEGPSTAFYTGQAITPNVTVKDAKGNVLQSGKDYKVSYEKNTEVGKANVVITGEGDYRGIIRHPFRIYYDLASFGVVNPIEKQDYNVNVASCPSPTVTYNDKTLRAGADYSISYKNNTKEGKGEVVITGMGDYYGELTQTFDIGNGGEKAKVNPAGLVAKNLTYNGKEQVGIPDAENGEYTITGNKATDAGSHQATITLGENATWSDGKTEPKSKTQTWTIAKAQPTIAVGQTNVTLTSTTEKVNVPIIYGGDGNLVVSSGTAGVVTAKLSDDKTSIEITRGTTAGTAKVTVYANAGTNYNKSSTLTITVKNEKTNPTAQSTLPTEELHLTWNGSRQNGVLDGDGYQLQTEPTSSSKVTFVNGNAAGTAVGTYKVKVVPVYGTYKWDSKTVQSTDEKVVTFHIDKVDAKQVSITPLAAQTYTGKDLSPLPKVTYKGKTLVKGTDYDVTYTANKNVGKTAKATLTFKGNYTGTRVVPFEITKANPALTVSKQTLNLKTTDSAQTLTVNYNGESTLKLTNSSAKFANATYDANKKTITITPLAQGTTKLTLSAPASANYNAATVTVTVNVAYNYHPTKTELVTISTAVDRNKVLDIAGGSDANSANVQIYTANQSAAQRFRVVPIDGGNYYRIESVGSGKVLDVKSAGKKAGTNVHQYASNNTDAQKWQIVPTGDSDGSVYLISKCNGLYLDVAGAKNKNGTNVQVYTGNKSQAQKFYINTLAEKDLKNVESATYTFVSNVGKNGGKDMVLDISGAKKTNSANAQIYESNGTNAQKFRLTYNANTGYYTIQNVNSNKVLDVAAGKSSAGTNVQQYASNGTKAQMWRLIPRGNDTYTIVSASGECCLDVAGAKNKNGTNVQIYTQNKTAAQNWTLKKA